MAEEPRYVEVDTDPLRSTAASYTSKSDSIRHVGLNFGNVLSAYSDAFGDDSSGKEVHKQFSQLSRGFLDGVHLYARVVDSTADGITMLARQYDLAEDHNRTLATKLDPNHDGPGSPHPNGPGSSNGPPTAGGPNTPGSGRGRH